MHRQRESRIQSDSCESHPLLMIYWMIAGVLTLISSILLVSCELSSSTSSTPSPIPPEPVSTLTPSVDPLSRIHHITPDAVPLLVDVVFTPSTTYEQAVALLGKEPYPWTCDEPRTPVPPPPAEQRAAFAVSHTLSISYAEWDQLKRIASSSQVEGIYVGNLTPCP